MINGWFPKINHLGQIASGNDGIWLDGVPVSPVGTSPFWIGNQLCYNLNDGRTQIGNGIIPITYNEYYGSELDYWTGFTSGGEGRVDFWHYQTLTNSADRATLAKYAGYGNVYGFNLAYVAPYQQEIRSLIYNNILIYQGKVLNYQLSLSGIIAWQIATSTYGRQIWTQGSIISVRADEDPITVFDYLGQSWIFTQTQIGQLIYPFGSYMGYYLKGDLFYPDARVLSNKLLVVGSDHKGGLIKQEIDFTSPRQDLRKL